MDQVITIWNDIVNNFGMVGAIAFVFGIAFILVSFLFMIILFIMGPNSIPSGEAFASEFHRAATGNARDVKRRLIFAFKWWPITMDGRQVLPYFTARFKRFYYLLNAMEWCTYGVCAIKYRKKFYAMIFSNVLSNIIAFAGLGMLVYGMGSELQIFDASEFTTAVGSSLIIIVAGAALTIFGFAMQIYPTYVMKKYMSPVIEQMSISDRDKSRLRFAVNVQFMLAIATMIMNILRVVSELYNKNKSKRR